MQTLDSLEHQFLIAMPNLAHSWFEKASPLTVWFS